LLRLLFILLVVEFKWLVVFCALALSLFAILFTFLITDFGIGISSLIPSSPVQLLASLEAHELVGSLEVPGWSHAYGWMCSYGVISFSGDGSSCTSQ
jgi:hypothetical protein